MSNKKLPLAVKIIIITMITLFFIGGVVIGFVWNGEDVHTSLLRFTKATPLSEEDIIEDCKDLDLEDTCLCLRDNIFLIYDYKINLDSVRSFEDISEFGGDCHDYSLIYERVGEDLGFTTETRRYDGAFGDDGEKIFAGHKFTVLWNEEGYCKLDQTTVVVIENEN